MEREGGKKVFFASQIGSKFSAHLPTSNAFLTFSGSRDQQTLGNSSRIIKTAFGSFIHKSQPNQSIFCLTNSGGGKFAFYSKKTKRQNSIVESPALPISNYHAILLHLNPLKINNTSCSKY
jgi:hypothetical protein